MREYWLVRNRVLNEYWDNDADDWDDRREEATRFPSKEEASNWLQGKDCVVVHVRVKPRQCPECVNLQEQLTTSRDLCDELRKKYYEYMTRAEAAEAALNWKPTPGYQACSALDILGWDRDQWKTLAMKAEKERDEWKARAEAFEVRIAATDVVLARKSDELIAEAKRAEAAEKERDEWKKKYDEKQPAIVWQYAPCRCYQG